MYNVSSCGLKNAPIKLTLIKNDDTYNNTIVTLCDKFREFEVDYMLYNIGYNYFNNINFQKIVANCKQIDIISRPYKICDINNKCNYFYYIFYTKNNDKTNYMKLKL
jgi:hypothetical protein